MLLNFARMCRPPCAVAESTAKRRAPFFAALIGIAILRVASASAADQSAAAGLAIFPAEFTLVGPAAEQLLVVEQTAGTFSIGQAEKPTFTLSNPAVVEIVDGVVRPKANGECEIEATAGGQKAKAKVKVVVFDQPFEWSFRNHVQSVLSKTGCNSGACHGAQAGKKGFKLSLRGYDPAGDWRVLTRQSLGRRIVPDDPGRSLLLTKPTGLVPHKGGVRLDVGSREYRVLAEWIAAGTPAPADSDPRVTHLEILPTAVQLQPGQKQQFLVRAHFTDGHIEDVTRWAKYASTNQAVADVDDAGTTSIGQVQVNGRGEGAITAWYLSKVVAATVTSPYSNTVSPEVFARAPRRNLIDEHVLRKLESLRLLPSVPASDGEFLRRAYLDTIGVLPTAEEARRFLADTTADKRDRVIDQLLKRPEFVDYWAYKWSDLLLVNSEKLPASAMWAYYTWIRNQIAAQTPWNEFVERLLTATGSTLENGAANFFVLHQDPQELAETASQAFLGMSIGCAKCHNHPLEKWTNDQYYGMANLFARVRTKNAPGDGNRIVFPVPAGELVQPLTGKPQPPRPLDAEPLSFEATDDRRAHLAAWLTSSDNPYFSRAIVNRVWANFFNVGLVENVDDMRLTNPPSNAALLDDLAKYLVEHKYQLSDLMRLILQSNAYQRSSVPLAENKSDDRCYSRYYTRRLMAEVLLDAISQVAHAPTEFPNYPRGWRAIQLPDSNVNSYFLKTFGRPDRVITCECERTAQPSMVQVLHLSNGDVLNKKLSAGGNIIEGWLKANTPAERIVEDLYLAAFSRMPTDRERAELTKVLNETPAAERRQVLEDLCWSVLSSREFLFNH